MKQAVADEQVVQCVRCHTHSCFFFPGPPRFGCDRWPALEGRLAANSGSAGEEVLAASTVRSSLSCCMLTTTGGDAKPVPWRAVVMACSGQQPRSTTKVNTRGQQPRSTPVVNTMVNTVVNMVKPTGSMQHDVLLYFSAVNHVVVCAYMSRMSPAAVWLAAARDLLFWAHSSASSRSRAASVLSRARASCRHGGAHSRCYNAHT